MPDTVYIPDEDLADFLALIEQLGVEAAQATAELDARYGQTPDGQPTAEEFTQATEAAWDVLRRIGDFLEEHGLPSGPEHLPVADPPEMDPRLTAAFERAGPALEQIGHYNPRMAQTRQPLARIPNAFPNGVGLVSSGLAMRGVVASIYAGMDQDGWEGTDGDVPTFDARRQRGARIFMRGDGTLRRSPELTKLLWEQVHGFSDLDVDVLVAMLAQSLAGQAEPDGSVWITASAILDYRGVKPVTKQHGDFTYRHGHRVEDIEQIGEAVGRLAGLWVELFEVNALERPAGRRKATRVRYSNQDRLVNVEGVERFSEHGELTRAGRWRIRFGRTITDFLSDPNRQVAPIMQKALSYDPYRATFQKRLAIYFAFHRRIAASYQTPLRRTVGDLLGQGHLPIDRRNPSRTFDRFKTALDRLVTDGVLPTWRYTAESQAAIDGFPARGWLADWLACTIEVPPDPRALPGPEAITERDSGRR